MKTNLALAVLALAACARSAPQQPRPATRFAADLAAAASAHDAVRFAELFAPDGELIVVGESATLSGRAAIQAAVAEAFQRFPDVRVTIARTWTGPATTVIELVVGATHDQHAIGVVGALALEQDRDGRATSARLYLDLVTLVGQADPAQVPDGAALRAPVTGPPAGTAALVAAATPSERANLLATDEILTRLVAHDAAGVLATASDDYVYEDFAGPGPLDRAGTEHLVDGFLARVPDFAIVATPTHFAAGDDVVVEQIEHMTFDGRELTLHSIDVKRFHDGRVVREWQYADSTEILTKALGRPVPVLP